MILAGAGSGKTRVITTRISHMVGCGIAPSKILAVTFTNKAANEMRERVEEMIADERSKRVTVCTFHSLCVRILRVHIERLGYKRNFTIYSGSDQSGLVRKIILRNAAREEALDPYAAISMISAAKNRGKEPGWHKNSLIAAVCREYAESLRALNAVDFDDLLVLAVELLRDHPDVREEWQRRFEYVMVDEFQDTNRLQMDLLRHLVGERQNVCVVGDDDQSIYGWRGAEISNILDFEKFFPDPKVIKLEENYRSTNPILHTANSLIRHNVGRREKRLWSSHAGGGPVRLMKVTDEVKEAEMVASEIWSAHTIKRVPLEDFAVVFRTNMQSRALEEAMRKRKIPYRIVGGQSFYDKREVKDILSYLSVIVNPDDDISLLRVINTPARGIGASTMARAVEVSAENRQTVGATLSDMFYLATLSPRARGAVENFFQTVEKFRDLAFASTTNLGRMVEQLVEEIGYRDHLKRSCKDGEENLMREENVREVIEAVHSYEAKKARKEEGLAGFLDSVALLGDKEEEDISKKKGVCLITLHASKGLEFPSVYLVGLEEGILPHRRSVDEGTRDEERRLLYVGITRAMRELTVSYCLTRRRYGDKIPTRPSSFLAELDRTHIREIDHAAEMNRTVEDVVEMRSMFQRMRDVLNAGGGEAKPGVE